MKTEKLTIIVGIVLMLIYTNTISAQTNFRNTSWGMDPSSVKAAETNKLKTETASSIIYDCSLAEIEGNLFYFFSTSNKLFRGKYYLTPNYTNINFYIRDYKMFEELLILKYGEPISKSIKAINKEFVTDAEWAIYLSKGNLRVERKWTANQTEIILTLSKTGDNPAIQIDYISKEFSILDNQEKKKIILKDL
ncbi:MAG: hypothetical protein ABII90_00450 [Bacteroidota bacterium]